MAGNKKTRTAGKPRTVRVAIAPALTRVKPANVVMQKMKLIPLRSLGVIMDQTGSYEDWMNILYRLQVGSVAIEFFFKVTPEIEKVFAMATMAVEIWRVRFLQTDVLGCRPQELDDVIAAFNLCDQAQDALSSRELLHATKIVEDYFLTIESYNETIYHWQPVEQGTPNHDQETARLPRPDVDGDIRPVVTSDDRQVALV